MLQRQAHAPPSVYDLADHLDGVLAACEDLLQLNGRHADMEWFLASVRRFELAAILQVLRVRLYAEELRGADDRLAAVASLFLAGTISFTEAGRAQGDNPFGEDGDSDTSQDGLAITDDYLIGHRIPISVLAEVAGAFLDTLEITYVLYGPDEPRTPRYRPAVPALPPEVVPAMPPPVPPFAGARL